MSCLAIVCHISCEHGNRPWAPKEILNENQLINQYANQESHRVNLKIGCNLFAHSDQLNFYIRDSINIPGPYVVIITEERISNVHLHDKAETGS